MNFKNIRKFRQSLEGKPTQGEFWTPLGVTQSGGSRYEAGRVIPKPVRTLILIAHGTVAESREAVKKLRGTK